MPNDLEDGPHVRLTVADMGHGMDRQTREHIFEPFYSTKEVGRGTSLGLAMVYGIAQNHAGHVHCVSHPAQGAKFQLYFPVLREEVQESGTSSVVEEMVRGKGETTLLVDDEAVLREFAGDTLTYFGYRVLSAASGEEALATYRDRSESIDLVILDLMMPGMGGGEQMPGRTPRNQSAPEGRGCQRSFGSRQRGKGTCSRGYRISGKALSHPGTLAIVASRFGFNG